MTVVIALLVKDKEIFLPLFLTCIYNQVFNKKNIHLYIRTNDNKDRTTNILKYFVNKYGKEYASVYYDDKDISPNLKKYAEHEWNAERFKILGKIRQESIDYAKKLNADYFVVDCDNLILPHTLEEMYKLRELGVISPMLKTNTNYSNYHYDIDENGYYKDHPEYLQLYNYVKRGIHSVKVVHCTYYIHNKFLKDVYYDDNSYRYEYVIFSDSLRKKNIEQYLDNRNYYGIISFSASKAEFSKYLIDTKFIHACKVYSGTMYRELTNAAN